MSIGLAIFLIFIIYIMLRFWTTVLPLLITGVGILIVGGVILFIYVIHEDKVLKETEKKEQARQFAEQRAIEQQKFNEYLDKQREAERSEQIRENIHIFTIEGKCQNKNEYLFRIRNKNNDLTVKYLMFDLIGQESGHMQLHQLRFCKNKGIKFLGKRECYDQTERYEVYLELKPNSSTDECLKIDSDSWPKGKKLKIHGQVYTESHVDET